MTGVGTKNDYIVLQPFHVITCAHVTHPFAFRDLYPDQDWLAHVTHTSVTARVEIRDLETGDVVARCPAGPATLHESLDLVALDLPALPEMDSALLKQVAGHVARRSSVL